MTPDFNQFIKYAELLHQYRTVERRVLIQNSDRRENDTEHSYSIAMLAWYIISTQKLDLNLDKIFQYSLAHDLVEVYAGDTYFYEQDASITESKEKREKDAAERIRKEFPEFEELHTAIEEYESRNNTESNFVYALDKVEPVLSIYVDKGRTWRKENISLDTLKEMKLPKVVVDKNIESIFKQLIERLEKEHDSLFNTKNI